MKKTISGLIIILGIFYVCLMGKGQVEAKAEKMQMTDIISVSTVGQMIKKDLKTGMYVQTEGYKQIGDQGGATYLIVKSEGLVEDGCIHIRLNNGYMAQLVFDSNSVINVASFGIFPNERISSKLNYMIECLSGEIEGIQFNNGMYLLDSVVYLDELNYYGNQTILQVTDDFNTLYDKVLTTAKCKKDLINIGFYSLFFSINCKTQHAMADRETQLLVLSKVATCTIQNCRFVANSGGYMPVTLVWFKGCRDIQQVKVIDSFFQHDGGNNAEEEKHLVGGCIWFSGDDAEKHKLSNILVESCIFSTSTSDEILAFWNGTFENVVVQNCYFTNCYQSSDNFISFNSSYFKDVILSNCIFTISENCLRVVKLNGLKGSNITVQGCDFYLLTNADAPWTDQLCIFSAANSSKKGNVTYNIIECNAISNDSTVYRAIINTSYTKNVTINVKHCLFDANVAGGIWWKEKEENVVLNIEK